MSTFLGTSYNFLIIGIVLGFIWCRLRCDFTHTHVYSNPDLKFDVGSLICASCIKLFITIHTFNNVPEKYGRILSVCCLIQASFAVGIVFGGVLFSIVTAIGGVFFFFEEIIIHSHRRLFQRFVLNVVQEMKEVFIVLGIVGHVMCVFSLFYAKACFFVIFTLFLSTQVQNLFELCKL